MNQMQKQIDFVRAQYPPGTRVRLVAMTDPYAPVPAGTMGTVALVDDAGNIHMRWDNGQTLSLVPGEDRFRVVEQTLTMSEPTQ